MKGTFQALQEQRISALNAANAVKETKLAEARRAVDAAEKECSTVVARANAEFETELSNRKSKLVARIAPTLEPILRLFVQDDRRSIAGELLSAWAALVAESVEAVGEEPSSLHVAYALAAAKFDVADSRLGDPNLWDSVVHTCVGNVVRSPDAAAARAALLNLEGVLSIRFAAGRPTPGRFEFRRSLLSDRDLALATVERDQAEEAAKLAAFQADYVMPKTASFNGHAVREPRGLTVGLSDLARSAIGWARS